MNKVDFIIVNCNTFDFVKILIKSIDMFVNCPYHIYIVDTSDQTHLLATHYVYRKDITIRNKKFVCPDIINHAVCNHIGGVNYAFDMGHSEYVCILDPDTVFVNKWLDKLIPLLEENSFVSNRFESHLFIARPQMMFFKRKFWVDNNLRFEFYKDTGGNISLFCQSHQKKYHILDNSYNNDSLRKKHVFPEIYCEQCFIDNTPFFMHQGRGASQGDRSKWIKTLSEFLNRNPYDVDFILSDILRHIKNKDEFKSTTSLKFKKDLIDFVLNEQKIQGDILEVGTNRGYTTAVLAVAAKILSKTIYSFDNNDDYLREAADLCKSNGLSNCILIKKDIYTESWNFNRIFGIVFIDAIHEQGAFEMDLRNAEKVLLKNGFIIAHDYGLENQHGRPIYDVLNRNKEKYHVVKYIGEKSGWNNLGSGKAVDFEGVIISLKNGE